MSFKYHDNTIWGSQDSKNIVVRNLSRYSADLVELPPWLELRLISAGF